MHVNPILDRSARREYDRLLQAIEFSQGQRPLLGLTADLFLPNRLWDTWREIDQTNRALDEIDRVARARLAVAGWPALGFLLSRNERIWALHAHSQEGKRGLSRYVRELFRKPRYRLLSKVVVRWWTVPYLRSQRPVLTDAIRAHKRRKYTLSIPPVLSAIDGLAREINYVILTKVPAGKRRRNKTIYVREVAERFHRAFGGDALFAIEAVYKECRFVPGSKAPSGINRHAIVHGKAGRYYTEENSLKLILLLETFAYIARGLRKRGLMA